MDPERPRGWTPRIISGGLDDSPKEQKEDPALRERTNPGPPQTPRMMLLKDAQYALQNLERIKQVPDRIDVITDYIFSLKGFVKNDENIAVRRAGLAEVPIQELIDHIFSGTEHDWKTRPSFYGAVMLEYNARILWIHDNVLNVKE